MKTMKCIVQFTSRIAMSCGLPMAAVLAFTVPATFGAIGPGGKAGRASASTTLKASPATVNSNPGIAPPDSRSHGRTYGDWGAAWWQWVLGIPADRNPNLDPDGAFCGEGQSGPVWFLGGTFGNSVERSCIIPPGRAIFVPVWNMIFGSGVFDCDPTVPGVPCDVPALAAIAAENTEKAEILDVIIDGRAVQNVRQYRARSPMPFSITWPAGNPFGVPAGTYYPQVSDGYWLMLNPLTPGAHKIQIHVRAPDTVFGLVEYDMIHHLTIRN